MAQHVTVVDSFTDTPFSGNPAGVCLLEAPTTEAWMQAVAAELNVSETAFLVPRRDGDHDLRWFSPQVEVDLCGHATLASSHVLGGKGRFHTRSGLLACRPGLEPESIEMDMPGLPMAPVEHPADWSAALGIPGDRVVGEWAGLAPRSRPDDAGAAGTAAPSPIGPTDRRSGWVVVELASPDDVRNATPLRDVLLTLTGAVCVVAAPGDRPGIDSVCRVFAPGAGIEEDPVTGSAHCLIAPWLAQRTGRDRFLGEQASARGGRVGMRVEGDRVVLTGRAVTVWEGTFYADPPAA